MQGSLDPFEKKLINLPQQSFLGRLVRSFPESSVSQGLEPKYRFNVAKPKHPHISHLYDFSSLLLSTLYSRRLYSLLLLLLRKAEIGHAHLMYYPYSIIWCF